MNENVAIAKKTENNNSCSLNVFAVCKTFTVWEYLKASSPKLDPKESSD
jgi:hypothetical protein